MKKPIRNEIKQHTSLKEADNLSLIAIFVESCSINVRETTQLTLDLPLDKKNHEYLLRFFILERKAGDKPFLSFR